MAVSSSFEVIYLGDKPIVDTTEGDAVITTADGQKLLGTYGSPTDPLNGHIHRLDPGSTGYSQSDTDTVYSSDNNQQNEKFTLDGGPEQTFDGVFHYGGTITYTDGTTARLDSVYLFQDADGKTYLSPSDPNTGSPLSAKPIQSITIDTLKDTTSYGLRGQYEENRFIGDPADQADSNSSTVFEVVHLGVLPDMDGSEGNQYINTTNVDLIANKTYGSADNPLSKNVQRFAPGSTGFDGGISNAYDLDNKLSNEKFTIDGGPEKTHDSTMAFNDSVITYVDGTKSEPFQAVIAQAADGNAYLVPDPTAEAAILGAGKIQSITLGTPHYFETDKTGNKGHSLVATLPSNQFFACFTAGTRILTDQGERLVDSLKVGDHVITADRGPQAIRWIGVHSFDAAALAQNPNLLPVCIHAGALGPNLPNRDLIVSRQHRMLMRSDIVERIIGDVEVLMPAVKLTALDGIDIVEDCKTITYVHLMCDRHEVIYAEGAATETLYPGPQAARMVGQEAFEEITTIFPELLSLEYAAVPARCVPTTGKIAKEIVREHIKNNRQLVY